MNKYILIFLIFISWSAVAQPLKVGDKVPELEFTAILNYQSSSAKLSSFQSKVILIDFWATWCSPCIENFPHLEKLQEKFKDSLQVITVTDESADRIKRFLQKNKTTLPIVLDQNRNLKHFFPHRTIPHSILIDTDGIVKAISSPSEINDEVIRNVLDRKPVSVHEKRDNMTFDPTLPLSGKDNIISQIIVTPYQEGLPYFSSTYGEGVYLNRRILAVNLAPKALYQIAYQADLSGKTNITVRDQQPLEWNKKNAICMDIIVPKGREESRFELMQQQLDLLFGYKAEFIEQELPVKVLRIIKGKKVKLPLAKGGVQVSISNPDGLSAKNDKLSAISKFLGKCCFDVSVFDETGDQNLYDIVLKNYPEDPENIHKELRKLGLELVDAKRTVKIFTIMDK